MFDGEALAVFRVEKKAVVVHAVQILAFGINDFAQFPGTRKPRPFFDVRQVTPLFAQQIFPAAFFHRAHDAKAIFNRIRHRHFA